MGGRVAEGKGGAKNYAVDLYGTNEGDEDAAVDKFDGDTDDFYIADAFGTRKEAYGRRVGGASSSEANFNKVFVDLQKKEVRDDARGEGAARRRQRADLGQKVRRRAPDVPEGPLEDVLPHHAGRRAVHRRQVRRAAGQ